MRLRKLLILVSLLSILVSCGDNKKDIKTRVINMYRNAPKVDLESGDVSYQAELANSYCRSVITKDPKLTKYFTKFFEKLKAEKPTAFGVTIENANYCGLLFTMWLDDELDFTDEEYEIIKRMSFK
jgi:hypothetical protein